MMDVFSILFNFISWVLTRDKRNSLVLCNRLTTLRCFGISRMFSHEAVYRLPGAFCPLTIVRTPRFFVLALSSTEFQCLALFEDVFLIFKVLMVPPCHVYFLSGFPMVNDQIVRLTQSDSACVNHCFTINSVPWIPIKHWFFYIVHICIINFMNDVLNILVKLAVLLKHSGMTSHM